MDIYELVRRYHDGSSISAISDNLSLARKTVRSYLRKAEEAGLGWEDPLKPKSAFLVVQRKYELPASYSSFKRFWRAKREELDEVEDLTGLRSFFANYIPHYNRKRRHSGIENQPPIDYLANTLTGITPARAVSRN